MGELITKTVPLAIGGAISPILVISVVLLLSGTRKPRARALAFAIGNIVALAIVAVVVLLLFHSAGHTGTGSTKAGKLIDLVLGVLLAAIGVGKLIEFLYRKLSGESGDTSDAESDHPAGKKGGVLGSLLLGVGLMATNITTIALYLSAVKDVAEAKVDNGVRVVVVAITILIIMVPVAVPLLITVVAPGESTRVLAVVRTFISRYRDLIMGVFVTGFGVYLTLKGVHGS
ncbi:MAG TPA: GAP family protein [Acidimicrobiales bacterium]|jgi:threonine/homoserine/homoserine lactone efflux protein|nr:GAP family protein [Acidimicrobiales bacterium]